MKHRTNTSEQKRATKYVTNKCAKQLPKIIPTSNVADPENHSPPKKQNQSLKPTCSNIAVE